MVDDAPKDETPVIPEEEVASTESEGSKLCPNCGANVVDLLKIDTGMKLALQSVNAEEANFPEVCSSCYSTLSTVVSKGTKLRSQKIAKEESIKALWRGRLDFVRQGQSAMNDKNYSTAAICYEKYLQSLGMGFNCKPSELAPSMFQGKKYNKELLITIKKTSIGRRLRQDCVCLC